MKMLGRGRASARADCARWSLVASLAATLSMIGGCTPTTARLNANFDSDALGALPVVAPPPTPPSDQLTWTSQKPLTSRVAANPKGGRWVKVVPLPAFIAAPDSRQLVLIASTEALSGAPTKIRGNLNLRMDGLGLVLITFQPVQGGRPGDYVGAVQFTNHLSASTSAGGPVGSLDVLRGFPVARIDDPFALPSAGHIRDLPLGTQIGISWSIDEATGTFSAGGENGVSQSVKFATSSSAPFSRVDVSIWMQAPTSLTTVFIDDLFAEEF